MKLLFFITICNKNIGYLITNTHRVMFSYIWPTEEKNIDDYTLISDEEKTSLSSKLVDKISSYFSSVQTKGLLVTVSSAIKLMGANKIRGLGVTPAIAAGAGVGTPTVLTVGGTDTSGTVTVTTGTAAGSNVLVTVTFTSAYTTAPKVIFSANNEITGTHISRVYATSTTTGFSMMCSSTALSNTTQYQWNYIVIQ